MNFEIMHIAILNGKLPFLPPSEIFIQEWVQNKIMCLTDICIYQLFFFLVRKRNTFIALNKSF